MNRCLLRWVIVLLTVGFFQTTYAADIYTLITQGKVDEARDALDQVGSDSTDTGNNLYFRALLEVDAVKSAKFLERALKRSPDIRFRDDITLRLAQFYTLNGDYSDVRALLDPQKSLSGEPSLALARLNILSAEKGSLIDDAKRESERLQKTAATGENRQWIDVDRARLAIAAGKQKEASTTLLTLSRVKSGPAVPQAMYLLCLDAINRGKADDAARWYNLLKDGYPLAVGLDALVDKIGSLPSEPSKDTRAEALTGTFYSVKVGVFSSADNAQQQAARFQQMKLKVESVVKTIGGKKYTVVYVGRFSSFDDAEAAKKQYEEKTSEQYQVVAR